MRARFSGREEPYLFQLIEILGIDKEDLNYNPSLKKLEIDDEELAKIMKDLANYLGSPSGLLTKNKLKKNIAENYSAVKKALS